MPDAPATTTPAAPMRRGPAHPVPGGPDPAAATVRRAEELYADLSLAAVVEWKKKNPGGLAIGHMPIYTPRELIAACGALPVGIQGGGDQIDIVKGDACFQSYLCHIPRSTVELGMAGRLDALDGMVFPSTCDVIRNLSGLWQVLFPGKLQFYLDLPQALDAQGSAFYRTQLREMAHRIRERGGQLPTPERLTAAIADGNLERRALLRLAEARILHPELLPADECYLVARAGNLLPAAEHAAFIDRFVEEASRRSRKLEDRIRVLVVGAFCEQPPVGLIRSLERAGCYVVGDDLTLGHRFIEGDIRLEGRAADDPLGALADAYMDQSTWASTRYAAEGERGDKLCAWVKRAGADGVVFAAPSFCDPALLDQPPLSRALDAAGVPYTLLKYAENTGQFQAFREQVGTFSDSIRLWGAA